jgi:endonuclease/exonuclease/phosphatase family metal-dependent hydrolase
MQTIVSLNLNGLPVGDERLGMLLKILKKLNPEIIVFQECTSELIKVIKTRLDYTFAEFCECFDWGKDYGKGIVIDNNNRKIIEGLGVISKLKFASTKIDLPIQTGIDRWPRIAQICYFGAFKLTNVHLSKHRKSRDLEWKKIPQDSIIIGDFNMLPEELEERKTGVISSYEFKKYISFPNENTTFDYCLLPKGWFVKVELIEGISDHCGLYLEIEF